jgi:hypothetical protein
MSAQVAPKREAGRPIGQGVGYDASFVNQAAADMLERGPAEAV